MDLREIIQAYKDQSLVAMTTDVQANRRRTFMPNPWADPSPLAGKPLVIVAHGNCNGFNYCRLRAQQSEARPKVDFVNHKKKTEKVGLIELMIPIESVVHYVHTFPKPKIVDELNGICTVWKTLETKDVIMFYIDVNTILKGQDPVWFGSGRAGSSDLASRRLMWLDPRKRKGSKSASIDFRIDPKNFSVMHSMCRYGCIVTFYRADILENAIKKKPIYRGKDK